MNRRLTLAVLAALAVLAYLPAIPIPLIEDDYPNTAQALDYFSSATMWRDPLMSLRATSQVTMAGLYHVFHLWAPAYHVFSLAMHIVNVWLLYAILLMVAPGAAAMAAGFFAIAEGHQEAVFWFSACNELFQFFFGALSLWLLMRGRTAWSVAAFALALLSKESAVIVGPLMLFVVGWREWKRLIPHAVLAALSVAAVWYTRTYSFRFTDGSFSLHAPVWVTLPVNMARLLWFWGLLAALVLIAAGRWRRVAQIVAWMAVALLPYSFLIYNKQIPSRQTYLASVGAALLVGLAVPIVMKQGGRRAVAALVLLVVVHNVGYLWIRKRHQFALRAEAFEKLIEAARSTRAPLYMQCWPRDHWNAEEAVHLRAGRDGKRDLVWDAAAAAQRGAVPFCYIEKKEKHGI